MVGARCLLVLLLVYSPYPAFVVGRQVDRSTELGLKERAADLPECSVVQPASSVSIKQHRRLLPGQLSKDWEYDGISQHLPLETVHVESTSMKIPLVGRGSEDPLLMDPFGAGLRVSTRYAYLGGNLCATIRIPEPASGTIFGMYLIDQHPAVSERNTSLWREADLEWLGWTPNIFQTSVYEKGMKMQWRPTFHNLMKIFNGTDQKDPVRYCIEWNLSGSLSGPKKKTLRFTAKSPKHPTWKVLRQWSPRNAEIDQFWSEPMRAIFTFWGNHDSPSWSGLYSLPAGKMLWVDVQDIEFEPKGPAYCRKTDLDL